MLREEEIRNPKLRETVARYREIYEAFTREVEQFGLPFAENRETEISALREELAAAGITERNEGASLVCGRICGACEACRTGSDSYTGILSLMCHRNCFFCFNPNQMEYEDFSSGMKDWRRELARLSRQKPKLRYIALTGGEPLLHKQDCVEFFRTARQYWPEVSMRLYTSGDLLDTETADRLAEAGLEEIRFSLKLEDAPDRRETVYRAMEMAKERIPRVMVEMPVLPDAEAEMREILKRLESIGIFGINLLELCFPYHNAEEFRKRGYLLRNPPYRTLYNFWYAGGLPIDGSELLALKLLKFAQEEKLNLNVHYCSLENKHFGQVYQQNLTSGNSDPSFVMSERDFYLKTVKAFGKDAKEAERLLKAKGRRDYRIEKDYIQFSPDCAELLRKKDMELGISYNIREIRDREEIIRELRLDAVKAAEFDGRWI